MPSEHRSDEPNWQPERFALGDLVVDPERPQWGVGKVTEDRTAPRSPTLGQCLFIEWEGRGLQMVYTAQRSLQLATNPHA